LADAGRQQVPTWASNHALNTLNPGPTSNRSMMDAFNENSPNVQLNGLAPESEIDEQKGFKFIFAGAATGIRNPRGHEVDIGDTPDDALDYLALASLLLRRLDAAGLR
jgi:uncharacterized protein (TIGR02391 family)